MVGHIVHRLGLSWCDFGSFLTFPPSLENGVGGGGGGGGLGDHVQPGLASVAGSGSRGRREPL